MGIPGGAQFPNYALETPPVLAGERMTLTPALAWQGAAHERDLVVVAYPLNASYGPMNPYHPALFEGKYPDVSLETLRAATIALPSQPARQLWIGPALDLGAFPYHAQGVYARDILFLPPGRYGELLGQYYGGGLTRQQLVKAIYQENTASYANDEFTRDFRAGPALLAGDPNPWLKPVEWAVTGELSASPAAFFAVTPGDIIPVASGKTLHLRAKWLNVSGTAGVNFSMYKYAPSADGFRLASIASWGGASVGQLSGGLQLGADRFPPGLYVGRAALNYQTGIPAQYRRFLVRVI